MAGELQRIGKVLSDPGERGFEDAGFVDAPQFKPPAGIVCCDNFNFGCIGAEDPGDPAVLKLAKPEDPKRIAMTGFDEWIKIVVG